MKALTPQAALVVGLIVGLLMWGLAITAWFKLIEVACHG